MPDLRPSRFLIQRRSAALEAIRRHCSEYGQPPSHAELGYRIGIKPQHVGPILRDLASAGDIELRPGRRGITLPRRLENEATSALLLELQARGFGIQLVPAGTPYKAAWPVASVMKVELFEQDGIANLP